MSDDRIRAYRFATAAQWRGCLLHRFDPGAGGLSPLRRLGRPTRIAGAGQRFGRVAADPHGGALARRDVGPATLVRVDEHGKLEGPFDLEGALAGSPRWLIDRQALWAFVAGRAHIRRYHRETLELDLTLDLAGARAVLDIAGDGADGIWALVADGPGGGHGLVHVDCRGHRGETRRLPATAGRPRQVAVVDRGKRLVLLAGERLLFLSGDTGASGRELALEAVAPGLASPRLTSDGRNRLVLWGPTGTSWSAFLLDGAGDPLDQIPPPDGAPPAPADLAVSGDGLWLATTDGLWRLDPGEASGARESDSTLLTPALLSPELGQDRGWLRAEVSIALPAGAVLEAEAASTGDDRLAAQARQIAADVAQTVEQRQRRIWELVSAPGSRPFQVVGQGSETPVAIPLHAEPGRWLWLRLRIVTPAGTPPGVLRELRVLYPNVSLAENLPAIFSNPQDDPGGFLRRLVGVLETTTQSVDARIRSIAAHVDPDRAPPVWLDYVARWLDLPWDDGLPAEARRRVLQQAGPILDQRGTRAGLDLLLRSLLGPRGSVRILDVTAEHAAVRLGAGVTLPALLAGSSPRVVTLSAKSRLGQARLSCQATDADPLAPLIPELRILLTTDRTTQRALADLLPRLLEPYLPAGVRLVLRWRLVSPRLPAAGDGDTLVLDGNGPAALGDDSRLGRTVLAGRDANRIDDGGPQIGFRLS
jgi:phage tail-like protein